MKGQPSARGRSDVQPTHPAPRQPAAPTHARRHGHARPPRGDAARLSPGRERLRDLPRSCPRHGDGRGHPPLPGPPDRERRAAADHQLLGVGAAVSLHRDARPARPVAALRPGAPPPQAPRRAERRGGRTFARSGAGTQAQGGARHRLRRGAARVRGGGAEGRRHRLDPHADPCRAGQGAPGPQCDAVAAAPGAAPAVVARRQAPRCDAAATAGCSRAATRSSQSRHGSSTARSTRRRRRPASASASALTPCATASRRTCWSRTSTSASSRCCSVTPSSTPPRSTPASPPRLSAR